MHVWCGFRLSNNLYLRDINSTYPSSCATPGTFRYINDGKCGIKGSVKKKSIFTRLAANYAQLWEQGYRSKRMAWCVWHFRMTTSCSLHRCPRHRNLMHPQMTAALLLVPSALLGSRQSPSAMLELVSDSRGFYRHCYLLSLCVSLAN